MLTGRLIASSQRRFAKAEAEFDWLTSEQTLVAGFYASRFTAPAAYVDTHSCAVVRMESEQNSSTLRHYLNLYVRISDPVKAKGSTAISSASARFATPFRR
jgi:hypothetical protein